MSLEVSALSNDASQARIALPIFEDLKQGPLSQISDGELLDALHTMKAVNPATNKACGMPHEVYDRREFCPDIGSLFCYHSHAFALIEETIRRLKEKGSVKADDANARLHVLHAYVSELHEMDMGGTFIQGEIDSGGQGGSEFIPYFLERFGIAPEELLNNTPADARVLTCQRIQKLQTSVAEKINEIRLWAIECQSADPCHTTETNMESCV